MRWAGKVAVSGSMYSLFIERAIRMPYQAVARCGGLPSHSAIDRVLWQYVQFTPSASDMCIIRP